MNNDDMQELVQDFLVETNEIIENLDHDLVELESNQNDLELLNKIFRGAHTMKGSSSFLGFNKLADLTHHAEDILNKLRKGEMVVTREIMDTLLEFVDKTKQIISDIENGTDTYVNLIAYGGIRYMSFNYTNQEWADFVKNNNLEDLYIA